MGRRFTHFLALALACTISDREFLRFAAREAARVESLERDALTIAHWLDPHARVRAELLAIETGSARRELDVALADAESGERVDPGAGCALAVAAVKAELFATQEEAERLAGEIE